MYGRDYTDRGIRNRYGRDFDRTGYLGRGAFWDRSPELNTGRDFDRGLGRDFGERTFVERDFDRGLNRGGFRTYDRDFGPRERMVFRASEHDRGLGDRMREGWNDVRRGARRMIGRDYDRGWW